MNRLFHHPLLPLALLALVALSLSGCSLFHGKKSTQAQQEQAQEQAQHFDMTLQSYSSGQFLLDGAVLGSDDLASHLAYLRDEGQLPRSVVLQDGTETKIHKKHLKELSQLAARFGFRAFYFDGDKLLEIMPKQGGD